MEKTHFADDETLEYIASLEQRNAELRAEVIEECAKVAEQHGEEYSRNAGNVYARRSGRSAAKRIVDAVRALAKTKE
jgi:L-lactate utilization protein LutB